MKQARLAHTREWINRVIAQAKRLELPQTWITRTTYMYKPILYALDKAIEKPVRMDGSRARCPDCGTGIRIKTDNYCFRCGQRLRPIEKDKKPIFTGNKHKRDRKNGR